MKPVASMTLEIREEPIARLADQALIASAFRVERVLDIVAPGDGLAGLVLCERLVDAPYVKDYDRTRDGHPSGWARLFDVSAWGLLGAWDGPRRVGGAVIAFHERGADLLEGQRDAAVLWDLRVSPELRGSGIGTRLFESAERWAASRGCSLLKIETQNINVPACRFYAARGCVLGAIHRFAYPELPHEAMLLWYRRLPREAGARSAP